MENKRQHILEQLERVFPASPQKELTWEVVRSVEVFTCRQGWPHGGDVVEGIQVSP